jgi:hypothetical protein
MMTPHAAAKAGVEGVACTPCDTPRTMAGSRRVHIKARGRSARTGSISITGDIHGHTSDASTRSGVAQCIRRQKAIRGGPSSLSKGTGRRLKGLLEARINDE